MKNLIISALAAAVTLTACNPAQQATSSQYDDVYSSSKQTASTTQASQPQAGSAATNADNYSSNPVPQQQQDDNRFDYSNGATDQTVPANGTAGGNTYVTNNYSSDDYYDYAYSSRIRRFNQPMGYSYYDPYYTNSYWYDYQPNSWGISIYSTYNWWAPSVCYSYNPFIGNTWGGGFGGGFGGGCGYGAMGWNPYGYRPYYYPFGGCGFGYNPFGSFNSYGAGFNNGYWQGYYNGLYGNAYNPYYYNSFDNNTAYYGHHKTQYSGTSDGAFNPIGGRPSSLNGQSLAAVYASNTVVEHTAPVNSNGPVKNNTMNNLIAAPVKGGSSGDVISGGSTNTTGGVKPPSGNSSDYSRSRSGYIRQRFH